MPTLLGIDDRRFGPVRLDGAALSDNYDLVADLVVPSNEHGSVDEADLQVDEEPDRRSAHREVRVAVQAAFVDGGSYMPTGLGLLLFGLGAGIAMPAATEMIMTTLPPARAGVGSAVNDTVREFGGALGIAVIGSIAATSYASSMQSELGRFPDLADVDRSMITNNVGAAIEASRQFGTQGDQIALVARGAFVDSMNHSLWIAAGLAFFAAVVALTQLPRQSTHGAHHGADESGHPEPVDARGAAPSAHTAPS